MTHEAADGTVLSALSLFKERLRTFREAIAERTRVEASLNEALATELHGLENIVGEVREAESLAKQATASVGVNHMPSDGGTSRQAHESDEPLSELTVSVALVKSAWADLDNAVVELKRHRFKRKSRQLGLIAVLVGVVLTAITGTWWLLQTWTTEQLYRSVVVAIEAGDWDRARATLTELWSRDARYKDSLTLHRETYYRPAVEYLRVGQLPQARSELEALIKLEPGYKDARKLWWSSWNLQEGACFDLFLIAGPDAIPERINLDCRSKVEPTLQMFWSSFLSRDHQRLNALMSSKGQQNASLYCSGAVVNCLNSNYAAGGYAYQSIKVIRQESSSATLMLVTLRAARDYCQTYDLEWTPQGWGITYFNIPQQCN